MAYIGALRSLNRDFSLLNGIFEYFLQSNISFVQLKILRIEYSSD